MLLLTIVYDLEGVILDIQPERKSFLRGSRRPIGCPERQISARAFCCQGRASILSDDLPSSVTAIA